MNGTETPQERSDACSYETIKPDAASAIAAGGGDEYAFIHGPKQWDNGRAKDVECTIFKGTPALPTPHTLI